MATTFKYSAKDASGRTVTGTMKADSQNDVLTDLRRRRLTPVDVKETGGGLFAGGGKGKKAADRARAPHRPTGRSGSGNAGTGTGH